MGIHTGTDPPFGDIALFAGLTSQFPCFTGLIFPKLSVFSKKLILSVFFCVCWLFLPLKSRVLGVF